MTITPSTRALLTLVFLTSPAAAQRQAAHPAGDSSIAKERNALALGLALVSQTVVETAEAMPADKYGFAPTVGEFRGVRTFGRQVKHLAATNYILAAAALGEEPPASAGDENGPDDLYAKPDVVEYLRGSFDALAKAVKAIGDQRIPVRTSPISPFQGESATRSALITESLIHAYDHYGQMIVYLRMNGIVPPASRR
jgi:hypothetical protein